MKFTPFYFSLFSSLLLLSCSQTKNNTNTHYHGDKVERWVGQIELKDQEKLPFIFDKINNTSLIIHNANERITLEKTGQNGDSTIYSFPDFESELHLLLKENHANGVWVSKNKTYQLPITAEKTNKEEFYIRSTSEIPKPISKKWRTVFSPDPEGKGEAALGVFEQKGNVITGTFLTETGDYRFLSGNVFGNKIYLSCFDGSHAFLFTASLANDTIKGHFFSGKNYKTDWFAVADKNYELTSPFDLTYIKDSTKPLAFSFNNLDLNKISYPSEAYDNKVTIVQIMGSWCPNCIDETKYYLDLYDKYHSQGLEIILVGYENGQTEVDHAKRLKNLKKRYKIPYEVLIGGSINKSQTSKDFPMLNNVISYPTSLFINRAGEVVKVHTGFYGPGTGSYYTEYVRETDLFIQQLLLN